MLRLLLYLIFFTTSLISVFSQENVNITLKLDWQFSLDNYSPKLTASDNAFNLIVTVTNNKIIAINLAGQLFWSTEILNEEIKDLKLNNGKVLVYSEILSESKYFIRELSIETGLIKLKYEDANTETKKLIQIVSSDSKFLLFYTNGEIRIIEYLENKFIQTKIQKLSSNIEKILLINNSFLFYRDEKNALIKVNLKTQQGETISISVKGSIDKLFEFDNFYFITSEYGEVYCYNRNNLKKTWQYQLGGKINNIILLKENLIVFSNDNFVYFLKNINGNLIWKFKNLARVNGLLDERNNNIFLVNLNEPTSIVMDSLGKTKFQFNLDDGNFFLDKPLIVSNQYIFLTRNGIASYSINKN